MNSGKELDQEQLKLSIDLIDYFCAKGKILTKKEYLERVKSIENQTNLALSKFNEGGKV